MRKLLFFLPLLLAAQGTKVDYPSQIKNAPLYVYPSVAALPITGCISATPFAIVGDTLYQNAATPPQCGWQAFKFNNTPTPFDYGCPGDGVTNSTACLQSAISALQGLGLPFNIPAGYTFCTGTLNITGAIVIGGGGTLKRCNQLAQSKGLLDITGSNVIITGINIDGQTTAPQTDIDYRGSPNAFASAVTMNTSIWIHPPATYVTIQNVHINHTGGYAGFIDARTGNISHIAFIGNTVTNSRSSLCGTTGNFNYGCWTGGFFWSNDGFSYSIDDMLFDSNRMLQVSGNTIWGHSTLYAKQNTGVRVQNNWFEDCGLDCIQMQNVNGGLVAHNNGKRVGYLSSIDNTPGVPKWAPASVTASGLFSVPAVAVDTTALVTNVDYTDNNFDAINGGWYDGDGYGSGTVHPGTGTSCWYSTDPYAQSGSCGPQGISGNANYSYGWNGGNSVGATGANVNISILGGQFNGFGGGAIKIYGCQRCKVIGANINHPPPTGYPPGYALYHPIEWGPFTAANATTWYPTNNVVTDNTAYWTGPGAMISEDPEYLAFQSTNSTTVARNTCIPLSGGSCYEIDKDPVTATTSGPEVISSTSPGACPYPLATPFPNCVLEAHIQVEGTGTTDFAYKGYSDIGGTGLNFFTFTQSTFSVPGLISAGSFLQANAVPYATYPCAAGPVQNGIIWITDSNTNSWGATIAGGGSNRVLAACDGTNWTVIGK